MQDRLIRILYISFLSRVFGFWFGFCEWQREKKMLRFICSANHHHCASISLTLHKSVYELIVTISV